VNSSSFNAIGIDVGGTKIAAALVTFPEAIIRFSRVIPTNPQRDGSRVLDDVVRLAADLMAEAQGEGAKVDGIGLGLCELVSPAGNILSANCIEWMDLPVMDRLSALAPFTLEADVRAAARAEALFGAGLGLRQFLYVTVGTGIASCLVIDGEPFTGARGATGTMASAPWSRTCEECGHFSQSTLEQFAAGSGLVHRLNQLRPGSVRTGHDVLAAATAGDSEALAVVRTGAEALGSTVALLVNVLDSEAVIIGGGLGLSDGPYWDALIISTRRHIWSEVNREIPIVRAATGPDAGVIGAAVGGWLKIPTK
jgi:predicted NBD/HSP70 family sugar kinase